jgi:hypothetical protein
LGNRNSMSVPELGQRLGVFEQVMCDRNPDLKAHLLPGLGMAASIRKFSAMGKAREILSELYSWHSGTNPTERKHPGGHMFTFANLSVVPCDVFIFSPIELTIAHRGSWRLAERQIRSLKDVANKYFPIFWNGGTRWIALEINGSNRVVFIDFDSFPATRPAYKSFEECIQDLIGANLQRRPIAPSLRQGRPS